MCVANCILGNSRILMAYDAHSRKVKSLRSPEVLIWEVTIYQSYIPSCASKGADTFIKTELKW